MIHLIQHSKDTNFPCVMGRRWVSWGFHNRMGDHRAHLGTRNCVLYLIYPVFAPPRPRGAAAVEEAIVKRPSFPYTHPRFRSIRPANWVAI